MLAPHGSQREDDGERDVCPCGGPAAFVGEFERLQAEGGKGGVATEQADHEKLAGKRHGRERGEEADEEGAADIDEEGAEVRGSEFFTHLRGEPEAEHAAESAAEGDEQVGIHPRYKKRDAVERASGFLRAGSTFYGDGEERRGRESNSRFDSPLRIEPFLPLVQTTVDMSGQARMFALLFAPLWRASSENPKVRSGLLLSAMREGGALSAPLAPVNGGAP